MVKSEQKGKWSVATDDDSSNAAGQQKILIQITDSHKNNFI